MSRCLQVANAQRGAATVMIVVILLLLVSGALISLFGGVQTATFDTVSGRERLQALMLAEAGLANARNRFLNGESCSAENFTTAPIAVGAVGSFSFQNVEVTSSMSCLVRVQGLTTQGTPRVVEANIFQAAKSQNDQAFYCIPPPATNGAFLINVNWGTSKNDHPDLVGVKIIVNGSEVMFDNNNSRFLKVATYIKGSGNNTEQISTQQILIVNPPGANEIYPIEGYVVFSEKLTKGGAGGGNSGNGVACLTLENVDVFNPVVQDPDPLSGVSSTANFSITPQSSSSMIVDSLVKETNHDPVMSERAGRELMWTHNKNEMGTGAGSVLSGATINTPAQLSWSFYNAVNDDVLVTKYWALRAVEIRAADASAQSVKYRKMPSNTGMAAIWREVAVTPPPP